MLIIDEKDRILRKKEIKHFSVSKRWERRWMRGENENLTVEREKPWKRLREKGLEVANKVGEVNFVFYFV